MLRGLSLLLIALLGLISFLYGFGVLMSHGWDSVEGSRESASTWQLLPPLSPGSKIGLLDKGLHGTLSTYRYDVADGSYTVPRWTTTDGAEPTTDVHYLSFFPQLAVPMPDFPWVTLFAVPLLACLLAMLIARSGRISSALRDTAEARARIAARKPVMR